MLSHEPVARHDPVAWHDPGVRHDPGAQHDSGAWHDPGAGHYPGAWHDPAAGVSHHMVDGAIIPKIFSESAKTIFCEFLMIFFVSLLVYGIWKIKF